MYIENRTIACMQTMVLYIQAKNYIKCTGTTVHVHDVIAFYWHVDIINIKHIDSGTLSHISYT